MPDVFPIEAWPAGAGLLALDGATHSATGLPHIAKFVDSTTDPSWELWERRQVDRLADIVTVPNGLRVVKVDDTHIGVFPGDYVINDTRTHFDGDASEAVSTSADTYYVYLDNANALTIVTDATGWPASIGQFVPLAEVTVADSVISSIVDRRGWASIVIGGAGSSASTTGTNETTFTLDEDNSGAGASCVVAFERGSSDAHDAGIRWNATSGMVEALEDVTDDGFCTVRALTIDATVASGTAPITVVSPTLCVNLNADKVDGIGFTAASAANAVPYATSTSAVAFTTAPTTSGMVFITGTSAVPAWAATGSASGVQAWDSDLDAIAAISSAGIVARTAEGTAAARTITAGAGMVVTYGDGVAGNPTIALEATTNHAVQVGNATGALTSLAVGATNTVLCGNTGANPGFRQIVNADLSDSAQIAVGKLGATVGDGGKVLSVSSAGEAMWLYSWRPGTASTSGSPHTFTATEMRRVWLNTGATSLVTINLPSAVAGYEIKFAVVDADGTKIVAFADDVIQDVGTVSATAGYIQSTTVGSVVHLFAINATTWLVMSKQGTWTIDS